jgi:hypothetical protein
MRVGSRGSHISCESASWEHRFLVLAVVRHTDVLVLNRVPRPDPEIMMGMSKVLCSARPVPPGEY